MTPSPSAPALRAAKKLSQLGGTTLGGMAEVIDEATGLPELIACLQECINYDANWTSNGMTDFLIRRCEKAVAAALSRVEQRDAQDLGSSR